MTELFPIKLMSFGISGLYFHDKETDIVYKLKDKEQHRHCHFWGLRNELHITEDDLVQKGILTELQIKLKSLYVIPYNSYK